jgi:DNA polymerase III delta prime subunit
MNNIKNLVWFEKYRPITLEQLVLEEQYKTFFSQILNEPEKCPHFLFHSFSPGTGKTSTAYLLCRLLKSDKLILNASSDRGIDIVREKVNDYTRTKSLNVGIKKVVILDEADGLTPAAQNSLRNLMEETISNAFFILTANHIEKIIQPLASRCIAINFNLPPKEQIKKYLNSIIAAEKVEDIDLDFIINKYYPDIRRMVLKLQSIKQGIKLEILEQKDDFENLYKSINSGMFESIKQKIISEEVNIKDFVDFLFEKIITSKVSFNKVAKFCKILADIEKYINFNVNPRIVFLSYVEEMHKCLTSN